jgi:hypothetical protein
MPMRMLRPSLVFVCVGDVLFSLFRATGEFMFAGSWRLRFAGGGLSASACAGQ